MRNDTLQSMFKCFGDSKSKQHTTDFGGGVMVDGKGQEEKGLHGKLHGGERSGHSRPCILNPFNSSV